MHIVVQGDGKPLMFYLDGVVFMICEYSIM